MVEASFSNTAEGFGNRHANRQRHSNQLK